MPIVAHKVQNVKEKRRVRGCPTSPRWACPNRVTNCDKRTTSESTDVVEQFRRHISKLEHTPSVYLHLQNKCDESEALYRADAIAASRYFPEGRKRMQKRLYKRLDGTARHGILMTCTVDPKRYGKVEAWKAMWKQFKKLMDTLNQYRMRNMGAGRRLIRIAVVEQQASGYPHIHVLFPGLNFLIDDLSKLDEWWGMGMVSTERTKRAQSARGYVLKYIGKMSGWSEECMAILWFHKIRLYNLSHSFFRVKEATKWVLKAVYSVIEEMAEGLGFKVEDCYGILESGVKFVYIRSP